MNSKQIIKTLSKLNPRAKLWPNLEPALIGIAARSLDAPVAVYSMESIVAGLIEREGLTRAEAARAVDEVILKAELGKGAPVILIETFSRDYTIGLGKVAKIELPNNDIDSFSSGPQKSDEKA